MKETFYIEYKGNKYEQKALSDKVKEIWKEQGGKVKDLKKMELYFKPDEQTCYYVINGDVTGSFSI